MSTEATIEEAKDTSVEDTNTTDSFSVITFKQTPSVPAIEGSVPVWIKENKPLIQELLLFAKSRENALGLAANQVSYKGERLMKRFFVHRNECNLECPFHAVIDPVITVKHGEPITEIEGCLSWPGMRVHAKRHLRVTVSYWTIDGEYVEDQELERFPSQVWQHEVDHLNGVEEEVKNVGGTYTRAEKKVGRNEPCPCGAVKDDGKPVKYKSCCGKV